jgi:hypothetical protein
MRLFVVKAAREEDLADCSLLTPLAFIDILQLDIHLDLLYALDNDGITTDSGRAHRRSSR